MNHVERVHFSMGHIAFVTPACQTYLLVFAVFMVVYLLLLLGYVSLFLGFF
ncbi:MAG: hypothetical protein B193_0277 [Solidesulfovibrio magneticus str. Maddingley MBC34]|uniref:Uncharacterized protein n=1 Tax=Solidesulfovibrio magneticus str. Maddingley MBC34 TaxID=1206767 RepID=K6GVN3_9BACT|nr:MAG: hypothetical protein B193_0277 [Solidesulfovibrio magneticus str. Maddingley MBC34]